MTLANGVSPDAGKPTQFNPGQSPNPDGRATKLETLLGTSYKQWLPLHSLQEVALRHCLFCENPANTKEHVWPEWILKSLKVDQEISHQIGTAPAQLLKNPAVKVKAVCKICNEGWMSSLEQTNKPLIGNLIHDVALSLNGLQQYHIAMWAIKTAMVCEFVARGQRDMFFDKTECEQLRVASNLPMLTNIWLGRHSFVKNIGFWGTDGWSMDRAVHAHINTVLLGHLVLQSVVLHVPDGNAVTNVNPLNGPRPWEELLTRIWPTTPSAAWPPPYTFTNQGDFSVYKLVRRYSYGDNAL